MAKPQQPAIDVRAATTGQLQLLVIAGACRGQFRGDAINARMPLQVLRQGKVDNRPPDAAVAVLERMDDLEPQVCDAGPQEAILRAALAIEPGQETPDFGRHPVRGRCDVMHLGIVHRPADDLHGVGRAAQFSGRHRVQARVAGRVKRRMPAAQAL